VSSNLRDLGAVLGHEEQLRHRSEDQGSKKLPQV
jgi:hypothetical protein